MTLRMCLQACIHLVRRVTFEGDWETLLTSNVLRRFGLDGSGIDKSPKFHPILGPILFCAYAALSNTLLVSLLVAILSGTYANIAADAVSSPPLQNPDLPTTLTPWCPGCGGHVSQSRPHVRRSEVGLAV